MQLQQHDVLEHAALVEHQQSNLLHMRGKLATLPIRQRQVLPDSPLLHFKAEDAVNGEATDVLRSHPCRGGDNAHWALATTEPSGHRRTESIDELRLSSTRHTGEELTKGTFVLWTQLLFGLLLQLLHNHVMEPKLLLVNLESVTFRSSFIGGHLLCTGLGILILGFLLPRPAET